MNLSKRQRTEMVAAEIEHAMKSSSAFVMINNEFRETLVVITADMSNGQVVVDANKKEHRLRATTFWKDGPVGHISHNSIVMIASDLTDDYFPESMRRMTLAEVDEWMSGPEFVRGCEIVGQVQAENEKRSTKRQCCKRDHDFDGNCDLHSAPGIDRLAGVR